MPLQHAIFKSTEKLTHLYLQQSDCLSVTTWLDEPVIQYRWSSLINYQRWNFDHIYYTINCAQLQVIKNSSLVMIKGHPDSSCAILPDCCSSTRLWSVVQAGCQAGCPTSCSMGGWATSTPSSSSTSSWGKTGSHCSTSSRLVSNCTSKHHDVRWYRRSVFISSTGWLIVHDFWLTNRQRGHWAN